MRNQKAQKYAIQLRKELTAAERRLWRRLRLRQIDGHKFRRQYPIGPYIADFACLEAKLIVELDGGQHADLEPQDKKRDQWIKAHGYQVLRFWNNQVMKQTEGVLEAIWNALRPHPDLPPQAGEGT